MTFESFVSFSLSFRCRHRLLHRCCRRRRRCCLQYRPMWMDAADRIKLHLADYRQILDLLSTSRDGISLQFN